MARLRSGDAHTHTHTEGWASHRGQHIIPTVLVDSKVWRFIRVLSLSFLSSCRWWETSRLVCLHLQSLRKQPSSWTMTPLPLSQAPPEGGCSYPWCSTAEEGAWGSVRECEGWTLLRSSGSSQLPAHPPADWLTDPELDNLTSGDWQQYKQLLLDVWIDHGYTLPKTRWVVVCQWAVTITVVYHVLILWLI